MTDFQNELLYRRSGLLARKKELRAEIKTIDGDIVAIERVLRILDPNALALEPPRPRRRKTADGLFADGELTTGTLTALRDLGKPSTSAECAAALVASKGIPADDRRMPEITNRVSSSLNDLTKKGRVRRLGNGDGRTVLWEVAR